MTHPTIKFISGFFVAFAALAAAVTFATPERRGELARIPEYLNRPLFSRETAAVLPQFQYLSRNAPVADLEINAEAALVWDTADGRALYAKNSAARRPIASITKLVTAAVVVDNADLTEQVTVSAEAVSANGTAGGLQPGEILSVRSLLEATLVESSNDAAYALSGYITNRTETPFVSLMNQKAEDIGLTSSRFMDPAGLVDEGAYSTAEDLARLLAYLRARPAYSPLWEVLSRPQVGTLSEDGLLYHEFVNTNPFLEELAGVIGGKTGFTTAAGESMVLLARSPDGTRELAYIILNSPDRFSEMRALINWVGSAYVWVPLKVKATD
jgi:D-alanyl-D-alanine carboxypeptidase (penicillin-binding protein 5/6)